MAHETKTLQDGIVSRPEGNVKLEDLTPQAVGTSDLQLLTTEETITVLGISEGGLYSKIREGKLHPIKKKGLNWFHPDEVHDLAGKISRRMGRTPVDPVLKVARKKLPRPSSHVLSPSTPRVPVISYDGEIAANATNLFDSGAGVRKVVVDLQITYELANHLYTEWKKAGPELHLPPRVLTQMRQRFSWSGDATPENFIRAMNAYLLREVERMAKEKGIIVPEGEPIPEKELEALRRAEEEEKE